MGFGNHVRALCACAFYWHHFVDGASPSHQTPLVTNISCYESRVSAYDFHAGDAILTTDHLESVILPKITHFNTTAGEQWEFDSTSDDGKQGLLLGLYRDAAYAFLGSGLLRVSLDLVWANGTTWSLVDYVEESSIRECRGTITGVWTKPGHSYTFIISTDLNTATVAFNTPKLRGGFDLATSASGRYADGSRIPSPTASTTFGSYQHWVEPIPMAQSQVYLLVESEMYQWNGMGGHMRFWGSFSWFDTFTKWKAFRARVGPYAMSFWAIWNRGDAREATATVQLYRDGQTLFSSQHLVISSLPKEEKDYFYYTPYSKDTGVSGELGNNATGYTLELVSVSQEKRWKFNFEHCNVEFEFDTGKSQGGTSFVGQASGGQVGGKRYNGSFFNEQVDITDLWIPSLLVKGARAYQRVKTTIFGF